MSAEEAFNKKRDRIIALLKSELDKRPRDYAKIDALTLAKNEVDLQKIKVVGPKTSLPTVAIENKLKALEKINLKDKKQPERIVLEDD